MPYHANGFRTLGVMGMPSATSTPGNVRQIHTFVTNDDKAAIETAAYFNSLLTPTGKIKKGDVMIVSFDTDGTEGVRMYVIDIVSGNVVLTGAGASAATTFVALTDSSGGTASDTVVDVPASYTEATLANQLASIIRAVNRLGTDVAALKAAV